MLITLIATQGTKSSSNFNNIFTIIKCIFIAFMVGMALTKFDSKNFGGVLEDPEKLDYEGVIKGAAFCYYGFIPVELTSSFTKEAINPKRDIPRSIIIVPTICLFIYIMVSYSLTGIGIV